MHINDKIDFLARIEAGRLLGRNTDMEGDHGCSVCGKITLTASELSTRAVGKDRYKRRPQKKHCLDCLILVARKIQKENE